MKMRRNVPGLMLILISCVAAADTITVGDTTHTDVYVTQGSTMYYVSNPEDGTILNVPLDQASGVDIIQDREARSALYRQWQKKNAERRGLPEPAPVEAADPLGQSAAEPFEPGTPLKPIGKVKREYDTPAPSVSSSNTSYNPVAYQQRMFEIQKNAQIAQLRQQREAQKMQRLRNVRVITSQDVAGRGMSGGSMGGVGGRGGMGGMGGMGGYGGRRR